MADVLVHPGAKADLIPVCSIAGHWMSGLPKFVIKKPPPHWLFVPSKRQVRDLLKRLPANVRMVEFSGTGHGRSADSVSLGFVEARVVNSAWCFFLRFWGARKSVAGPVREELSRMALAEIEYYIQAYQSRPATDTVRLSQLYMCLQIEEGRIRSACRDKAKDRHLFPSGDWWQEGAEA